VKNFQRKIEDFQCENCGVTVEGNGYTNHCRFCLWSKHVDINPGDRAARCGGLMEPIELEIKKGTYIIVHKCLKCGYCKRNKSQPGDSMEQLIRLSGG